MTEIALYHSKKLTPYSCVGKKVDLLFDGESISGQRLFGEIMSGEPMSVRLTFDEVRQTYTPPSLCPMSFCPVGLCKVNL